MGRKTLVHFGRGATPLTLSKLYLPTMRSDDDGGPDLPAGVLRSRGGWDDANNLEIEHQRERLKGAHDAPNKSLSHAAVDLSQFRNEEVGKGYQAKHVVRQREGKSSTVSGLVDLSGGKFSKVKGDTTKKRSHDGATDSDDRLDAYLNCEGMRAFRREINKILKQR